jgi:hypothetical protein
VAKATPLKPATAKSAPPKPLSGVNPKKSAPKKPSKNAAVAAKSLKLAAERRVLVDASMVHAQNAVIVAVQGIAQIVHGPVGAP